MHRKRIKKYTTIILGRYINKKRKKKKLVFLRAMNFRSYPARWRQGAATVRLTWVHSVTYTLAVKFIISGRFLCFFLENIIYLYSLCTLIFCVLFKGDKTGVNQSCLYDTRATGRRLIRPTLEKKKKETKNDPRRPHLFPTDRTTL